MRRRRWTLLGLLAALLTGGCGGGHGDDGARSRAAAHARELRIGAGVFREQCRTCHPLLGRPAAEYHGDAPPLDLDQVAPTRAYARQRLEQGGISMGGFRTDMPARQRRAVLDYVLAVGGREVTVPDYVRRTELADGRALYEQRCRSCHAIAGRPHTGPEAATSFEDVRPSVLFVEQKVTEGIPEIMPSFGARLEPGQVRAIALYVNAAAR